MDSKLNKTIFYLISLVFIAINLYLISIDIYYFALLPVVLLLIAATFISLDKVLLLIVFFTPLSVGLRDFVPEIPVNIYMPTEPLLIGVLFLFIFKILLDGKLDIRIIKHPVTIVIFINLFWLLITSLTSTMPIVSFKFLLSRLWFVVGIYLIGIYLFKDIKNVQKFLWCYIIPLVIVVAYYTYRLSGYGLNDQKASNWVVWPFFSDHTSYGAMLVMFFFPVLGFLFLKKSNLLAQTLNWVLILIFVFAIILSYTRAAWLSLFAAIGVWGVVKLKIKLKYLVVIGFAAIAIFMVYSSTVFFKLEKNDTESSGDFGEHIQSMANISTDASNMERINRWKCAIKMFEEKPIFGWGTGTYMFQYAPFQYSGDRTIISTNFGDWGNAHSEYLGALSESGILGMVSFLFIMIYTFITGFRVYHSTSDQTIKILSLCIILGLVTYFIHGVLNNFLDTDKASVPFWGFIGMLVAMDIYHKSTKLDNRN